MEPDLNFDPFSPAGNGISIPNGAAPPPSVDSILGSLSVPSYLQGPNPVIKPVTPVEPISVQAPYVQAPVSPDTIMSSVKQWDIETLETVQQRLAELADNKKFRGVLTQKLQQQQGVVNPVTNQVLVFLAEQPSASIPYVLEFRQDLLRLLQNPVDMITVRYAQPAELVSIMTDWYEQIKQSYIAPLQEWATWLGETNE